MTTMKEIAEQTGVSISTVSLVLNGRDEGRVNPTLASLVRNKATELGYKINPLARSLRTNKTRILGFISEEVATTPYAGGIILGAQDAASAYGYMLFTVSTDGKASEENEIATLKRYGVDGFFYSKMSNRIAHVPESLNEYPVVMVDATDHENKVPSIEPDEFMIGYDATNRLIQAGCKRIAYVGCAENMIAQDGRLAGYRTALQEAGRAFNPSLVCNVMHNGPALRAVNKLIGFSAMGAKPSGFMNRNVNNAGYMIGTWTPGEQFKPETEFRLWDCGHNYYAPQSFNDGKRQIVYGWMSPFVEPIPMQDDGWCGNLTLPREITLGADGDLHTAPVAEMEGLREDTVDFGAIDLDVSGEKTIVDDAEAVEIEMTIDLANSTAERAGLRVHATEDGAYTSVAYDDQIGRVVVDRQANAQGDRGYRTAPLSEAELAAGELKLRVYVDRGCVEVYVNDGRQVLSSYSYAPEGPRAIKLVAESGTLKVKSLVLHHMKSIGLE